MDESQKFTLSVKDVARMVGCKIATARTAFRKGELPSFRYNARVILTSRAHVLAWTAQLRQRAQVAQLRIAPRTSAAANRSHQIATK